ncbi:Intraflagellar transport protein 74 [Clonorchis sinensis]|uniref:Intraflagellar transport protein 74 n=2 Tax=Clonorchis sinensis TaxID=79923 RepID=A0A419PD64_CLOSI|nr:Intraflagellar transport protein 74 [Clonorchis sinensis]
MPSVLAKLRETGRVLVWQPEKSLYSRICFPRWQQIALFRRFPDVETPAANRFGLPMSALRPGTASRLKTAQTQNAVATNMPIGIATRLTTGLRPGTRAAVGTTLNTSVQVEDRPITQQGLSGLKTAVRGTRRQIEDKPYFLGLLRGKINEINLEINNLTRQAMDAEEENASFVQYEQMAEKLALEIKELQGELGDYNTLVDKATLGDDVSNVELDWEELRAANERAERNLESLFEERQAKERAVKSAEEELRQEQNLSETMIQDMSDDERQKYLRLRELNTHLMGQLADGQAQLEQLLARQAELEEDLSTSQIKQEAIRLYAQLHEAEARRDQLLAEENSREDPQQERERLLQQVREDNQEIASIERQTRETQEKVSHREDELHSLEQELDDNRSERNQKYRELKKREQQIDEFLKTFDEVHALEQSSISELQANIVELLENTSRHIQNASQTTPAAAAVRAATGADSKDGLDPVQQLKEQLEFKTSEVSKSERTASALSKERARLSQDLLKVDQLETKVSQEMEALRKRIANMEEEIKQFSDLDKVKEDAKTKSETLTTEKQRLEGHRESLHKLNQSLAKEYSSIQNTLTSQDTHMQLTNLERRWAQHEQTNYALMESIANKRLETDHKGLAAKALEMVRAYNECLKTSLSSKPVVL